MRAAKIVAIVIGAILILVGLALVAPGGFLLWAYETQRDSSGFFETSTRTLSTNTYALTTPNADVNLSPHLGGWAPKGASAVVRIRAMSSQNTPLFVGIGPTELVSQYLSGVAHDEVTNFGWLYTSIDYRRFSGGAPSGAPGQQGFWAAKQEGSGELAIEWHVESGNWAAVIMNADGSSPVTASVSLGARLGVILLIAIGILAGGLVLLAVGIVLVVLGARHPQNGLTHPVPTAPAGGWPVGPQQPPPGYVPPGPQQSPPGYVPPGPQQSPPARPDGATSPPRTAPPAQPPRDNS